MSDHNLVIEKIDTNSKRNKTIEDGIKAGIFGSIKDKEIAKIEHDRWWGGPRGPEKITFNDGCLSAISGITGVQIILTPLFGMRLFTKQTKS